MMIVLREAVGLVADLLEQAQAEVVPAEFDRGGSPLDVDQFFLFGQAHDHRWRDIERIEDLHGGVELAEPAVDQDHLGVELAAAARLAVAPADDLLQRLVVIIFDGCDLISAVLVLEGSAIDETDLAPHRLVALEMGDVKALDAADRFVHAERALQTRA